MTRFLAEKELAQRNLVDFIKQAWHVLEPTQPYIHGWHIDAMSEHLMAVSNGQIHDLIINIPPRHMKSLEVVVFWPAWEWIEQPGLRYLCCSYGEQLSKRDNVKKRRLIQSQWYQERWGDRFQLVGDQNEKLRYENDKTGYSIATSTEGMGTGEGGDRILVDDPHNVKEVLSDTKRTNVLVWWKETMQSRLNNVLTGARIIIMQRLHEKDLAGHILAENTGYDHLCLPAEYEGNKCHTRLGFTDPRTKEGELLYNGRFNKQGLAKLKSGMTQYGIAGQLQQRPAPMGGGYIKREWFEIVSEAPLNRKGNETSMEAGKRILRWWDLAATEEDHNNKDPDYTAGALVSEIGGVFYVENIIRFRESPHKVESVIKQTAQMDSVDVRIYMEQEGGAGGKTTISHYARNVLQGFWFKGIPSRKSKQTYIDPFAAAAENGLVKLVKGEWNKCFLDEVEVWPNGKHDDSLDAASKAYTQLCRPAVWWGFGVVGEERVN